MPELELKEVALNENLETHDHDRLFIECESLLERVRIEYDIRAGDEGWRAYATLNRPICSQVPSSVVDPRANILMPAPGVLFEFVRPQSHSVVISSGGRKETYLSVRESPWRILHEYNESVHQEEFCTMQRSLSSGYLLRPGGDIRLA